MYTLFTVSLAAAPGFSACEPIVQHVGCEWPWSNWNGECPVLTSFVDGVLFPAAEWRAVRFWRRTVFVFDAAQHVWPTDDVQQEGLSKRVGSVQIGRTRYSTPLASHEAHQRCRRHTNKHTCQCNLTKCHSSPECEKLLTRSRRT